MIIAVAEVGMEAVVMEDPTDTLEEVVVTVVAG